MLNPPSKKVTVLVYISGQRLSEPDSYLVVLVSNGPPGWQIVLSSRLGCLHCVLAAGGEGKAGAGAETSVEYSN